MTKRKHMAIIFLVSCLTGTLLGIGITGSQNGIGEYDPWCDLDDDGWITIADVSAVAIKFGSYGDPINKTELLLELQDRVDSLNGTLETRIPQTGYISVPGAAFVPENTTDNVFYSGFGLENYANKEVLCWASVQLPHGARITNVTFHWYDRGNDDFGFGLVRGGSNFMDGVAEATSFGNETGIGYSYDDTIDPSRAIVDNSQYFYELGLLFPNPIAPFPNQEYRFYYAVVEYEYTA